MNYHAAFYLVPALFALGLAISVIFRESRGSAHRYFVAGLMLLSFEAAFTGFTVLALTPDEQVFYQKLRMLCGSLLPFVWVVFSLTYSRGNSELFLKNSRVPLAALLLLPVLSVVLGWRNLIPSARLSETQDMTFMLSWGGLGLQLAMLAGAVLTLMNLERTYKASVGTMRWQIKFMLLGVAVVFGAKIYTTSQVILFRATSLSLQMVAAGALFVGCLLLLRALVRAGLFKVDVYPSEKVLQNSITGLLAGAYLLVVGLFARLVTWFGGTEAFPLKASLIIVALAGLAMLLLSDRLRQYLQDFVARHFGRPRHDYRTAWLTLTERTASIQDPEQLARTVANWISENLHALSVTIWLHDERAGELKLAASTCFTEETSRVGLTEQQILVNELRARPEPFILDERKGPWVQMLKAYYADNFKEGGSRVCVPLLAPGRFAGMITLGDRANAAIYGGEDLDLLKCVGDQFASNLLNLKLSAELVQAKELEAFQTIAAFFVHDLKNTASTMSLMLQNFKTHFDNPEFREDALRAIGKATTHIQELVRRLSLFRQQLELKPAPFDLNELVETSAECLNGRPELTLVKKLAPLPKITADPEQLNKVLTNLLLNAAEAMGSKGEIRLETCQQNGWFVVSVSDNGCGMSPEFIKNSLFRPFQSTKKGGLGIGMFHTRMIIESHRGKIEVQSQPGAGTTFRVLLPPAPEFSAKPAA